MNNENKHSGKNILELILIEENRIRLTFSRTPDRGPITFYQENEISFDRIADIIREINHHLIMLNTLKRTDSNLFKEFQKSCQLLYDELLSPEIKRSLQSATYTDLELILDDQLLHIPWELIFNGKSFLCEQFNIGRQIRASGSEESAPPVSAPSGLPLRMLIIADPTDDLEVAYHEGCIIKNEFQAKEKLIHTDFKSSTGTSLSFVKKNLRDYNIVHYAGHVDNNPDQPKKSGWVLSDGDFTAKDIMKMINGTVMMPYLIFCNACASGSTGRWARTHSGPDGSGSQGLVHAFIMAGARYYIGTFSEVSDEYGAYMGVEFYSHLLAGNSIGESLRKARESFREKFGRESFFWINYMLYGDPGGYLMKQEKEDTGKEDTGKKERKKTQKPPEAGIEIPSKREYVVINPPATRGPGVIFPRLNKWMWMTVLLIFLAAMSAFALFLRHSSIQETIRISRENHQQMQKDKQERIRELRKEIYERLKEREVIKKGSETPQVPGKETTQAPGKTDARKAPWTSAPLTMAVLDITDPSKSSLAWPASVTDEVYKTLSHLFVENPRIQVVERNELDTILHEKALLLSDMPLESSEDRQLFGRFLYAKAMLFLDVYQARAGISLSYRLVDGETGKILEFEPKIVLNKKDLPASLAEAIYDKTKDILLKEYPLRGRITSIQNGMITIDIGSETGVAEGGTFAVFDPDHKNRAGRRIGQIRVMPHGVEEGWAQCEIIIGNGFKEGQKVESMI